MRLILNPLLDTLPDVGGLCLRSQAFGISLVCNPLQASLLHLFNIAADLDDVCAEHPRARTQRPFLERCRADGLLLAVEDNGQAIVPDRVPADFPFVGAPSLEAVGHANVVGAFAFVGIPWDRDVSGRAGARFGPSAVRAASASWAFALDPISRRPRGFFDLGTQQKILEGVGFADVGDVLSLPGDSATTVRARMRRSVADVTATGAMPLVVGGDHSITRPVIAGVIDALEAAGDIDTPICIVHFDAHTDLGDAAKDSSALALHHGNVMTVILEEVPRVKRIVQLGLRSLMKPVGRAADDRVTAFGIDQLDDVAAVLAAIPTDHACWFSLDIDVVDPAFAPSTGTPVPGGMLPRELWRLIEHIGSTRHCLGIDLVEVAEPTGPGDGTAGIAATCLMRFCRAMVEGPTWRELDAPSQ